MKLSELRELIDKELKEFKANNPQRSPSPSRPSPGIAPSPDRKTTPTRKPGTNPGKFPRPNIDPAPAKAIREDEKKYGWDPKKGLKQNQKPPITKTNKYNKKYNSNNPLDVANHDKDRDTFYKEKETKENFINEVNNGIINKIVQRFKSNKNG